MAVIFLIFHNGRHPNANFKLVQFPHNHTMSEAVEVDSPLPPGSTRPPNRLCRWKSGCPIEAIITLVNDFNDRWRQGHIRGQIFIDESSSVTSHGTGKYCFPRQVWGRMKVCTRKWTITPLGCARFPEIWTLFMWTRRNWEFRRHRMWSLNRQFQCKSMKNYRAQTPQNLGLTKILHKFRKTSTPLPKEGQSAVVEWCFVEPPCRYTTASTWSTFKHDAVPELKNIYAWTFMCDSLSALKSAKKNPSK